MEPLPGLGRILIFAGLAMVLLGVIRRGSFTFYFPVATCIVLSIILTVFFWLLRR